jgi:hypothetical protein
MDKPQADQTETIKQLQAQLAEAERLRSVEKERADRLNDSNQQSLREKLVLQERCERQAQAIVQRDATNAKLETNLATRTAGLEEAIKRINRLQADNARLTAANTEKNWIIGAGAASFALTALSKNTRTSRRRY